MKSIAVIGLSPFGYQIAVSLAHKGFDVIALDENVETVAEIKDLVAQAIVIDSTDEKAMWSINIDNVDKVILAMGSNVQASLLTTALLQSMQIEDIYVRAINSLQENILRSMGIKHIINIEKEMGIQIANILSSERVGKYVEISERHSLVEIAVPKSFVGKSLVQLDFRAKYAINIVGIKTRIPEVKDNGEVAYSLHMTDVPDPHYPLQKDDILVMAGTDDNLGKILRIDKDND